MKLQLFTCFVFLTFPGSIESTAQERGFDPESFTATFYDEADLGDSILSKPYTTSIDFCRACFEEDWPFSGCKLTHELADGATWSASWQGKLIVPFDGEYIFELTNVDDGARVFLDGNEIMDKGWYFPDDDQRPPPQTVNLNSARYEIRIDYEQRVPGAASLQARWTGPGFEDEVIPMAGVPPPFSTSIYLTNDILTENRTEVDFEKLNELGGFAALKGKDGNVLVILDFGSPVIINAENGTYGAMLNFPAEGEKPDTLSTFDIRDAAISFLQGYWEDSQPFPCAHLTLAIGTKNDRLLYDLTQAEQIQPHGISWAELVNEVDDWIKMSNRSSRLEVAGGIDLERWSSDGVVADPEAARLWVEAFVNATDRLYFNYGTCVNCGNCTAMAGSGDWEMQDYWYLSWGVKVGQAYPIPEIYSDGTGSKTHACQWRNLMKFALDQCGEDEECRRLITIPGTLTQCEIVDPFQDEVTSCRNNKKTNMPAEGWQQLYEVLLEDPTTAHAASLLSWSTDIMNVRHYKPVVVSVDLPATDAIAPQFFMLSQNYPNPFNPTTTIHYSILQNDDVILKVYNLLGQEIATLVREKQLPGDYEIHWSPVGLPSGVYLYRIQVGTNYQTRKLVLLK